MRFTTFFDKLTKQQRCCCWCSDYNVEELENLPVYDVADVLKLYFHELPDCLLTERLSETCCSIFTRKAFTLLFNRMCALGSGGAIW